MGKRKQDSSCVEDPGAAESIHSVLHNLPDSFPNETLQYLFNGDLPAEIQAALWSQKQRQLLAVLVPKQLVTSGLQDLAFMVMPC